MTTSANPTPAPSRWATARTRARATVTAVLAALDLRDVHFYGGLLLVVAGGWKLSHAWTLIAAGLVLMFVALRKPR